MADLFLHYGRMGLMAAPVLAVLLALLPHLRRWYRAQGRCVLWLLLTLWLLCPVLPELPQAPVQVPLPAVLVQPTAADPAAVEPAAAEPDPATAEQGSAPAMTLTPLTVLPAVWAAAGDMELASDDLALRGADRAARRRYAETVYTGLAAGCRRDALPTSFQGGKDIMERRFTEILGFGPQKKGRAVVVLAVACVLALTGLVGCTQRIEPSDPEAGDPAAVPVDPPQIGTRQGRTAMLSRAVELADAYFLTTDGDGNDVVLRYQDPYPLNAQTVWVLEERDGRYLVAQPALDAPCYVNGWVERDAVSFDPALIAQGEFVELTDATLYEDRGETVAEEHVDSLASIEARDGDWTKVYLPGGQEGWVATDALSWDIDQQVRCLEG